MFRVDKIWIDAFYVKKELPKVNDFLSADTNFFIALKMILNKNLMFGKKLFLDVLFFA